MKNYLVYNQLIKDLNSDPFQAGIALLKELRVEFELSNSTRRDIGYELRGYDNKQYCGIFEDVLDKKSVIALENSSYLGLCEANKFYNKECNIIPLHVILKENSKLIKSKIVHSFQNFNIGIHLGEFTCKSKKDELSSILTLTGANVLNFDNEFEPDGYSLLEFDKNVAFKMGSNVVFDAFDKGCDLLIVDDIRSFHMFDYYQKELIKTMKRPLGENGMTILSISQVLLTAFGLVNENENLTATHKVKPSFIE